MSGVDRFTILNDLEVPESFVEHASDGLLTHKIPLLFDCILRRIENRKFGLECGQNMHPCLLGAGGFAATHAPTLNCLLQTLKRFIPGRPSWCQLSSSVNSQSIRWSLELSEFCSEESQSHLADAWAASAIAFGRVVLGREFQAEKILMKRQPPHDLKSYYDYFGDNIYFASSQNRIVIASEYFHKPSLLSNDILFEQLNYATDALGSHQSNSESIVEEVQVCLRGGTFELTEVARILMIGERTLQRRLKSTNTSFQTLRDEIRLELAEAYLKIPTLTVEKIAERLGFSGNRAFRSAYRRWTGLSPRKEM